MTADGFKEGAFPNQYIERLISSGYVKSKTPISPDRIQPSSLDLSVSNRCWLLPASIRPEMTEKVVDLIEKYSIQAINLETDILIKGQTYIVELNESLELPKNISARVNTKSSLGRIDGWVRVITDLNEQFDVIKSGYKGKLFALIVPGSFHFKIPVNTSLNQIRFFNNNSFLDSEELKKLHKEKTLLYDSDGKPMKNIDRYIKDNCLIVPLDLTLNIVGYIPKNSLEPIDLGKKHFYEPEHFWSAVYKGKNDELFLKAGVFYLLMSYKVSIPPEYAAEMMPFDESYGDLRTHYAGFFDPGFGYGKEGEVQGNAAVLEVRGFNHDVIARDGTAICLFKFEKLSERATKIYGEGSNYGEQKGINIAKFFKPFRKGQELKDYF